MTALFNGMKYSEIQPYVLKENGKLKLNVPLMRQSKRYQTDEMAKVVDFVEKNDHKDVVDLALTGMGIDEDELTNNPDKQFNETAKDALDRVANVYKAMSDGGYDIISNEGLKMVREYIKTGSPSIDVLTGKGIFEKSDTKIVATLSETLQKAVLDMQVSDKEQLTKSIKIFLEDNKTAGLDIITENGKIYVKNNGAQTELDFKGKFIQNGSLTIKCDTYLELIRAATLTNFLKKELAGKSQTDKPFYESQFTGDVKFDDGVRYKPDVDAVTAGKDRGKWGVNLAS